MTCVKGPGQKKISQYFDIGLSFSKCETFDKKIV